MSEIQTAAEILASYQGRPLRIMEVCGTHTHEIFRLGIRSMLPEQVELISGPGCPVCVTPVGFIDEAVWLAEHGVTITTFGDLVRVPGTEKSLAKARSEGGKVQVVYSPLDALDYAKIHPEEEVCFLSVGFETTTPAPCLTVEKALAENVKNYSLLTANKTMPNAYAALKGSADVFLYPGHVHAIIGTGILEELAQQGVSGVLAGFTAKELLTALAVAVRKAEDGKPFFVNAYPRVVRPEGAFYAFPRIEELGLGSRDFCVRAAREAGVALVPGAAFDRKGGRLGLGAGFYDRFLTEKAPQGYRCALAFSCQLVERVPMEPHDVAVQYIVTENEAFAVK